MPASNLRSRLEASSYLWTPPGAARKKFEPHEFAGYGSYNVHHTPRKSEMERISVFLHEDELHGEKLDELEATSISGNDILSSTFYVSGLVSLAAGILAPLCLALVGLVLYLFRGIYHETVMALPCNGGTYNILLNCTSKQVASMAAVFAIIAYITTGVVSALEAVAYLDTAIKPYTDYTIDKQTATIVLLAFFCLLTNMGMKESATFAKVIFLLHVATLTILTVLGTLHTIFNSDMLVSNWSANTPSFPKVDIAGNFHPGNVWTALFYGYSSAMLGVSGFETSSQFVEEQAPGVFPKTLRNMWLGIMIYNPLLSLISFSALTLEEIEEHHDTVLARTASVVGTWMEQAVTGSHVENHDSSFGQILETLVSVDAFIVLAAALLTGYVGINGLIRRMAMDRCLPQFFLLQNPWTHTDSFILVGFFLLCVSQVLVLEGDVRALGGVYCYAFLTVMAIFAYGNILLKLKRPSLPREVTTGWVQSIVGFIAIVVALLGNILGKPELLTYFFVYVMIVGLLVLIMFQRVRIMRLLFKLLKSSQKEPYLQSPQRTQEVAEDENLPLVNIDEDQGLSSFAMKDLEVAFGDETILTASARVRNRKTAASSTASTTSSSSTTNNISRPLRALSRALREVQDVPFVFFCKHDDLYMLNKAMLYIQKNEQTNKIIVVHCKGRVDQSARAWEQIANDDNNKLAPGTSEHLDYHSLTEHVKLMDLLYPRVKISLLYVSADFSPITVEWLSQAIQVPINAMFISCPDENFTMKVTQLRGMRIIFSYDS